MEALPSRLAVNGRDYHVVKLLGKGKGGYSYLARGDQGLVCVKQIHHEPCSYYQFGDKLQSELRDYRRLQQVGIAMPRLLDADEKHERLVKEYLDGPTVYELVKDDFLPSACLSQLHEMCRHLVPNNLNIDYFPTNFIWQNGTLYYVDYECNAYMDEWNFENWGSRYWSKTPEFLQYVKEHE